MKISRICWSSFSVEEELVFNFNCSCFSAFESGVLCDDGYKLKVNKRLTITDIPYQENSLLRLSSCEFENFQRVLLEAKQQRCVDSFQVRCMNVRIDEHSVEDVLKIVAVDVAARVFENMKHEAGYRGPRKKEYAGDPLYYLVNARYYEVYLKLQRLNDELANL